MMKKIVLSCLLTFLSVASWANGTLVEGIYYTFSGSNATVTYTGSSKNATTTYTGVIDIPETVNYEDEDYTVTAIDTYAFYKGTGITSISIPKGVSTVGTYAFYGCTALEKITVYNPSPLTVSNSSAFTNVPTSTCVLSVPTQSVDLYKEDSMWNVFENIEGFGYTFSAITLSVTNLTNTSATLSGIISTEDGEVTTDQGFEYWANSSDVKTVKAEGSDISAIVSGLEINTKYTYRAYATNSSGATTYGNEKTFTTKDYNLEVDGFCYNITTEDGSSDKTVELTWGGETKTTATPYSGAIEIPEYINYDGDTYTVTGINQYSFYKGEDITSITIPETVTYIGQYAFYECEQIKSLVIPDNCTSFGIYTFDGCTALEEINIPNGTTSIPDGLFLGCNSLTEINIPESVTSFCTKAFYNCTSATKINIPSGITELPSYTFYGCQSLTNIDIPEGVLTYGTYVFAYCYSLKEVVLPSKLTSIADYLFYKCTGLSSVPIPEGVTSIGKYAFEQCESLASITLPDGLTSLGSYAFDNCYTLEEISIPIGVTSLENYTFNQCKVLIKVDLPANLTSIGKDVFYSCSLLPSLEIPNSVTTIGDYAFAFCTSMTSISLGTGVATLSQYAFDGCSALSSIIIPDNITSIGNYAFYNCTALTYAKLGEGLTTLGTNLFNGCTKLEKVELGSNLTAISNYAFRYCESLIDVNIPEKVTSIGQYSFGGCSILPSIVIPASVTSLAANAFYQCYDLKKVTSLNTTPPTCQSSSFNSVNSECTLYVTADCVETYSTTSVWKDFYSINDLSSIAFFSISDAGYSTYYTDYEYTMPEGVTGTIITSKETETGEDGGYILDMSWDYVSGTIVPAKTALLLKGSENEYEYTIRTTGETAPTDNLLLGSTEDVEETYGPDGETEGYLFYKLTYGSTEEHTGVFGFYWGADDGAAFESPANKAWLAVPASQARSIKFFSLDGGGDTTGISTVVSAEGASSDTIYTIQGVRVNDMTQKGLYIVNGKKILVK